MRNDKPTPSARLAFLEDENAKLKRAASDLHWMSRRYADGRRTYAVSMHNDATRLLLEMGIKLNPTGDGTLWAQDGDARDGLFFDLHEGHHVPGHPIATGQVLGLLPHHHLARSLEDVLGTDPLKAVLKYAAAMAVVKAVRNDQEEISTCLPSLACELDEPLSTLAILEAKSEGVT